MKSVEERVPLGGMDTPSRKPNRRMLITGAIAIAVITAGALTWALWPSGLDRLRDRDAYGAAACETLINWLDGDTAQDYPEYNEAGISGLVRLTAGKLVSQATTPSIHATWGGGGDVAPIPGIDPLPVHKVDMPALYDACVQEGVDMPPRGDMI